MSVDMKIIEQLCRSAKADGALHGVALAAGSRNSLDLLWAWGSASVSPVEQSMREDAVFDIASLTKVVATTSACAVCIDRGLLDPEAPACRYLPKLGELSKGTIRVCDLATHCSGYDDRKFDADTPAGMISALVEAPAQWPARTRYEYSCRNFIVMGLIVEAVTGKPLATFCRETIFSPLGMDDTTFGPIAAGLERVVPTQVSAGVISDPQARQAQRPVGNAGLFSSARDLALFCQMMAQEGVFRGRRIIGEKGFTWLTRRCSPEGLPRRSFGWDMRACPESLHRPTVLSDSAIGHSGWTGQSMWIDPKLGVYVVVLTNRAHALAPNNYEMSMRFRSRIADAALGAHTNELNTLPGRISLCEDWEFTYTPDFEGKIIPDNFEARMPVPGIWDDHLDALRGHAFFSAAAWNPQYKPMMDFPVPFDVKAGDASLPYLHGTGWYRRVFVADAQEPASRYVLNVGPARMETHVWVNRKLMGCHKGHNTPFRLDITEAVVRGRANDLVIAVTNTCTDRFGCDTRGYKGQSGGITGETSIDVTGPAYIDDLFVHETSAGRLCWRVVLGGCVPEHATLRWRIERQDGQEADRGTHEVADSSPTWTSDATGLVRWSDVDPVLHRLVLVLEADDRVLDRREQPAGFRRARVQGRGLLLNDSPLYLRGGTEHCYFPETCTPPMDKACYVERVKAWRRLGVNWLRCHTWVPGEPFLEAADEAGMLVQVEPARGYSLDEWAAIVRTCRKHPSVILYCCGNEEWLDDRKIDFLEQCQRLLKALAPDALFNPQEALRGVEYGWDMDLASDEERAACVDEPFRHHPARLNRLREFSDVFGNYPWGKFSYSSCYGDLARLDNQMSVYGRPLLGHEIGILGTYIDLSLESRYAGTRIGTDLYAKVREHLAASGVLALAPVYFRNSCRQMYALVKDLLESARMCTCLAGYDWLAPSDHHWHRSGYHCGVLNEFQEAKWEEGIADIIAVNSASVLLLDHRRAFNLAAVRPVSLPLILSLYGARPIDSAEVTWRVVDSDGGVLAHGGWTTGPIANGGNAKLGDVDWEPETDAPRAVTLEAGLQAANLHLANRWTFWIFPVAAEAPTDAGVHVVDSLSLETVGILERGGRVVLMGPGPFPALETRFQPSIAGRQTGDATTLVHSHPALGDFPHEGFCDWQFKPLRDGSHNIVFDDLGIPFDPIIEIASSYKHVSRRAVLFELAVGAGRLLVCSLNLAADDAAARYLKRQLIRYAGSDRFAPRTSLSAERLRRIIQGERAIEAEAQTDMALDPNAPAPPAG